jgi:hypothetical protein
MSGESVVYDEPADWIVEQARNQGVSLSRRQLADWHRAGLIEEPDREFLGGSDGSESIYPAGTLRQAIACSILMKRFRSVERVGWELWMRGFAVSESYWRNPLGEAHEAFRDLQSESVEAADMNDDGPPMLSDKAEENIAKVSQLRDPRPALRLARRRLGRQRFKEFLSIAISAMIGGFKLSDRGANESADPAHLLARLVGTEPAKNKARIPSSPFLTVSGQAVAENLEAMADELPQIVLSLSPEGITEAQLASARNELVFLINSFLSVRENEARITPGSTPDVKLIRRIFSDLSPKEQAIALLIWLSVRNIPGWRENLEALRQSVLAELSKGSSANGKPQPD